MIELIKKYFSTQNQQMSTYFFANNSATWMPRDYKKFADEAYIKNVIAHRAVSMIAHAAASIPLKLFRLSKSNRVPLAAHPILQLLAKPNPSQSGREFLESIYAYRQIAGNAYILGVGGNSNATSGTQGKAPLELYSLRPDRITVVPGENFIPKGYKYQVGEKITDFKVNPVTGASQVLHIKNFHPLSDWYGLSSIEAAAYSIDQHNQSGQWNQALLQNGARPSGAIIVKNEKGMPMHLTDKQYTNLKSMVDEVFSGPKNAGRPLLLEGGLDWKEMSISPKDMDFINSKHSSARDIALALGMPPQLLGIPSDNTYSNLHEARLALWEQTVLPMVENVVDDFNSWLTSFYGKDLEIAYSTDEISALSLRREALWNRLEACSFMTVNEKRQAVGLGPITDGDRLVAG